MNTRALSLKAAEIRPAGCGWRAKLISAGLVLVLSCSPAATSSLPALTGRVVDDAEILSPRVEAELVSQLEQLERRTSDQLIVVTVPDLKGEAIEVLGLRLGNGWGIGQKDVNNGVLLIVAPADRKVRIEVGFGLEGLLTDERAGDIIQNRLIPAFREGNYEQGVLAGVTEISRVLLSDPRRPRKRPLKKAA